MRYIAPCMFENNVYPNVQPSQARYYIAPESRKATVTP